MMVRRIGNGVGLSLSTSGSQSATRKSMIMDKKRTYVKRASVARPGSCFTTVS